MSTDTHLLIDLSYAGLVGASGYGLVDDGTIAIQNGVIVFAGPRSTLPQRFSDLQDISLNGRLVTPGLIDCHTHLVYAGSRADEFEMRLNGVSYEETSKAGGGIFSTVEATRNVSEDELLEIALMRLDRMLTNGVTTVEVKSGYGLDRDTELRMLRVAKALERERPIRVRTTFLGAHAVPKDMDADAYLSEICLPTLRDAVSQGLVDAVDGFCEGIAFSSEQIARVFDLARELDVPVKLHAEQLSNLEGAALAASYGALSVDHLEHLSDEGVTAMAMAGTVAVLLPGAFYALGETRLPPIKALKTASVSIALATDCNPGSAPMTSLLLAMNMGAVLFGLTPEDCLRGVTVNAARALGVSDCGQIAEGMRADLAVWDAEAPAELTYRIGDANLYCRYFGGKKC